MYDDSSGRRRFGLGGRPCGCLFTVGVVFHLNKDGLELGDKPTDYMALAKLVKAELSALRDTVNSFVSTFNSHNHSVSGVATAGSPAAQTQTAPVTSAAPGSSATAPASVKDVASAFVKSIPRDLPRRATAEKFVDLASSQAGD